MRTTMTCVLIVAMFVTTAAAAAPGAKSTGRLPKAGYDRHATLEVEPNDSCAEANFLSVGGAVAGTIDHYGDHDWFQISVQSGQTLHFTTLLSDEDMDTELYIYGDDCSTELDYNDDTSGYASYCVVTFVSDGVCYAMVMGYDDDTTGNYVLTVQQMDPAVQLADDCGGAVSLPAGPFAIEGNTTGYDNDFEYDSYGRDSSDVVFGFVLADSEWFRCNLVEADADMVLYLATDCADIAGTVLGFSDDDLECLYYQNQTGLPQTIYLTLDGYCCGESGSFVLMGENQGRGLV